MNRAHCTYCDQAVPDEDMYDHLVTYHPEQVGHSDGNGDHDGEDV